MNEESKVERGFIEGLYKGVGWRWKRGFDQELFTKVGLNLNLKLRETRECERSGDPFHIKLGYPLETGKRFKQ